MGQSWRKEILSTNLVYPIDPVGILFLSLVDRECRKKYSHFFNSVTFLLCTCYVFGDTHPGDRGENKTDTGPSWSAYSSLSDRHEADNANKV